MKVKSSKLYLVSSNNYFHYFTTLHMVAVKYLHNIFSYKFFVFILIFSF